MSLLLEILGLVLVAAVVRSLISGGTSVPLGAALTAVAAVVGAISFWGGVWRIGRGLIDAHDANARFNQFEARNGGGVIARADLDFLSWAGAHLPKGAGVYLECGLPTQCLRGRNEWITYQLLPHLFVASPRQADYVLFYYVDPHQAAYARGWRILRYGSRQALGVRPR
jgi:hypothetical protein